MSSQNLDSSKDSFGLVPSSNDTSGISVSIEIAQKSLSLMSFRLKNLSSSSTSHSLTKEQHENISTALDGCNMSLSKALNNNLHELGSSSMSTIPQNLPLLQWNDQITNSSKYVFVTIKGFCDRFEYVLLAHGLNADDHWYRLLPLCLAPSQLVWFRDTWPENPSISWSEAAVILETQYSKTTTENGGDTPSDMLTKEKVIAEMFSNLSSGPRPNALLNRNGVSAIDLYEIWNLLNTSHIEPDGEVIAG
ncbi:hypothetical protein BY458DRAFT_492210 [Sporodiniella umbellata]|nr:hypothetical protein BY458DRAFT_492210 [Sporodiniella umbellata]